MSGLDAPYWTIGFDDAGPRVPWSGEVVPIEVPPVPVDVPVAGPVLHFIGEGERAIWNDVWGWIKGESKSFADQIVAVEQRIGTAVVNVIEGYVGNELKAFSGFINRSFDYAQSGLESINFWTSDALSTVFGDVQGITAGLTELENIVGAIEQHVIPGVFQDLLGRIEGVYADLVGGIDLVKSWAIDNIYDPLTGELGRLERDTVIELERVAADARSYADQLVHNETLARIAAIAGLAAAVDALVVEAETCTTPMCDTMGPNTDLGKLLKGLALATDAAFVAELLRMDERQLAALIQTVVSHFASLVGDFEQFFGGGGETVGGLIKAAVGGAI